MRRIIDRPAASGWWRLSTHDGLDGGRRRRPESTLGIDDGGSSALPLSPPRSFCAIRAAIAYACLRELTHEGCPTGQFPRAFPEGAPQLPSHICELRETGLSSSRYLPLSSGQRMLRTAVLPIRPNDSTLPQSVFILAPFLCNAALEEKRSHCCADESVLKTACERGFYLWT